ncbi:MAG TPA: S9 family peptidase, partial [Terriglobia bacterium]
MATRLGRQFSEIVVLVLLAAVCGLAAQGSFTLQQVMSSPFPTELVSAPAGEDVAWVFNAGGVRNIWMAAPAAEGSYRSRQLTKYTADDGQDIAEVTWTPDGRSIVYARGGDFENDREYPNPASAPEGVEQDIWMVSTSGGEPRKLAEGHAPAVSPKGDAVAYVLKDQVWQINLAAGAKPEQLIHDRGKSGSLRWSPDGSRLAFVSRRGDHSLVVVYGVASKNLRYLDPSVDHDSNPAWSPDSRWVAFLRIPS